VASHVRQCDHAEVESKVRAAADSARTQRSAAASGGALQKCNGESKIAGNLVRADTCRPIRPIAEHGKPGNHGSLQRLAQNQCMERRFASKAACCITAPLGSVVDPEVIVGTRCHGLYARVAPGGGVTGGALSVRMQMGRQAFAERGRPCNCEQLGAPHFRSLHDVLQTRQSSNRG